MQKPRDPENESLADKLSFASEEERAAIFAQLPIEELKYLEHSWKFWGRPKQQEPGEDCPCGCEGRWLNWVLLSGRGFGKSRTGSEWVHKNAFDTYGRFNLVGATAAAVRDIIVEGESGIMETMKPWNKCKYQSTKNAIVWENGAKALTFSAEEPERLRGHQAEAAWCDELAAWTYMDETWRQLQMGLRLGPFPRTVITTTPKPFPLIKRLVKDKRNHVTRGNTFENISNLSETFIHEITQTYEGTRFGRQEIEGEILDESDMALWTRELLEEGRIEPEVFWPKEDSRGTAEGSIPPLKRIVIGVDPSMSFGTETAAETGIVVCGLGRNDHAYVLQDASGKYKPEQWAKKVATLYHYWMADRVIAEANQGHALVKHTIAVEDPTVAVKDVHAQKNKITRAEPISTAYERQRVHHVGNFKALEDQMCQWEQGDPNSPDRMDACLIGNTPVLTQQGWIPISDIVAGAKVWTRQGWQSVEAQRLTKHGPTITIELSSGQKLSGTPDHRVWVDGGGWRRLDALVWGDILSGWSSSSTEACSTPVTQTQNNEPIGFTEPSDIIPTLPAQFVEPVSNNDEASPKPVPVYVERSYESNAANVYDLQVSNAHEFVAAGVIVHNCVWALTDLIGKKGVISVSGMVDNELAGNNYWRNEDAARQF